MLRSSINSDRQRVFRAVCLTCAFYGTIALILFAAPFPSLARPVAEIFSVGAVPGSALPFRSVQLTLVGPSGSTGSSVVADGLPAKGIPVPPVLSHPAIEQKIIVQPEIVLASASSSSAVSSGSIGTRPTVPETTGTSETASAHTEGLSEESPASVSGSSVVAERSSSADGYGFTGKGFLPEGVSGSGRFVSWIDGAIRKKLSYPERARRRNIEGSVIVALSVPADGSRCETSILESSGSSILDDAALNLLKSLFPTPVSPEKEFHSPVKIQYLICQD